MLRVARPGSQAGTGWTSGFDVEGSDLASRGFCRVGGEKVTARPWFRLPDSPSECSDECVTPPDESE
jgi:hypothetical protein